MNVKLAPTNNLPLQIPHGIFCMSNVKVRNHHEATVLALGVQRANRSMDLKE
jgi:hypothetical protein